MRKFLHAFFEALEGGILYKELTQCMRGRIFFYSYLLLCLVNMAIYMTSIFISENCPHIFLTAGLIGVSVFTFKILIWSIWLSLREFQEGNHLIIELSGKRPAYIVFQKLLSFLTLSYLGCLLLCPTIFLIFSSATFSLSSNILLLFCIPLLWIPAFLCSLSCTFLPRKYLRYPLTLISLGTGILLFVFTGIAGTYYLTHGYQFYVPGAFILVNIALFYISAQLLSADIDSYIGELKLTGSVLLAYTLWGFTIFPEAKYAKTELAYTIHILFMTIYLLAYSNRDHIPSFTKIRAKRNLLTLILHNYFGPGRRNNLRYFLFLSTGFLLTMKTNLVEILVRPPHVSELFLYPVFISLFFKILTHTGSAKRSPFACKIQLSILMLGFLFLKPLTLPSLYNLKLISFNTVPQNIQTLIYAAMALIGMLFLIGDHYGFRFRFKRKNSKKKTKSARKPNTLTDAIRW